VAHIERSFEPAGGTRSNSVHGLKKRAQSDLDVHNNYNNNPYSSLLTEAEDGKRANSKRELPREVFSPIAEMPVHAKSNTSTINPRRGGTALTREEEIREG